VLQCLFSLPLQDNIQTCVGKTQSLLRLATHPSPTVRSALSLILKMRLSEMKVNGAQWMVPGSQQDPLDFLGRLCDIPPQPGVSESELCKVLCFVCSEQIVDCHCGKKHTKHSLPHPFMKIPSFNSSCNCDNPNSSRCKCTMFVQNASNVNNATVEIPDFKCSLNSATGRANKKSAGPDALGSPEVAVVAQMRGIKDCACVDLRKCNHVVTT
jgi:hypothetical protein